MAKIKITPEENQANMQNPNKGTKGTNKQYDQNQGNSGKQNMNFIELAEEIIKRKKYL